MTERWDKARGTAARSWEMPTGELDGRTLKPVMRHMTNEAAIRTLMDAMRQARSQFDALKLANPNVEASIATILAPVEDAWSRLEARPDRAA